VPTASLDSRIADIHAQDYLCPIQKSGRIAKPPYQGFKTRAIFLTHFREVHCQSTTGLGAPHNCVGADLSSWTRNSSLAVEPTPLDFGVSTNRPPKLKFRTREMSSRATQRQSTHTPSGVSTREVNLLE